MSAVQTDLNVAEFRHLTDAQIRQIHELHRGALPNDVMPAFGVTVLGTYLRELCKPTVGTVLVAEQDGRIVGFIALRFAEVSMARCVDLTGLITFIGRAFMRPRLMSRLFSQLRQRITNPPESAEIDFFLVDADHRGMSVGGRLIGLAETKAAENGRNSIFTKTSNARLCDYYVRAKQARKVGEYNIGPDRYFSIEWPIGQ